MILNVFENIEANDGIGPGVLPRQEFGIQRVLYERMHVRAPGEVAMVTLNTLRLHVNSHHVFAIQEMFREIPYAAADFENPLPQVWERHAPLPVKIIDGEFHPLLISDGVFGCGLDGGLWHGLLCTY
jgi:hypothetical protein